MMVKEAKAKMAKGDKKGEWIKGVESFHKQAKNLCIPSGKDVDQICRLRRFNV